MGVLKLIKGSWILFGKYRWMRTSIVLLAVLLLSLMVVTTAFAAVFSTTTPADQQPISFSRNSILAIAAGVVLILIAVWRGYKKSKHDK